MKNYPTTDKPIMTIWIMIILFMSSCQVNRLQFKTELSSQEKIRFSVNDTFRNYFESSREYLTIEAFGFCVNEFIAYLAEDTLNQYLFENYFLNILKPTQFKLSESEKIIRNNEFIFLRDRIRNVSPSLQNLDSYCRLKAQLDSIEMIPITDSSIINLIYQFERADGAQPWELSSVFYSLLIQHGSIFIDIIRKDKKATELYIEWIKKIEWYEFVAFGTGNLPPQIIERRRSYLLELLDKDLDANEVNKLTYNSIKYAKLRMVN